MKGHLLLGLDGGSTVCKAALYDLDGTELAVAQSRIEVERPHPGWAERDMDRFWQRMAGTIRHLLDKTDVDANEIAAAGCTGHGNGVYLLDGDGRPLRNAILSIDTRAGSIVAEWQREREKALFPRIHQHFYPGQTAPLLAWLKRHEPETYAQIGSVLLCKDVMCHRLTGALGTDFTDISATALLDVAEGAYVPDLLAEYDIPEIIGALVPPVQSAEVVGRITPAAAAETGLAAGTPVVAGMIDIAACAVGAGAVRPGQACIVAGTWNINEVVTASPIVSPDLFLTAPFADPTRWLTVEASATSASNLEWFVAQFCGEERRTADEEGVSVYEICDRAVADIPAEGCNIIFHPFLYGTTGIEGASGGFCGLNGWHTRAHLLRALYEGVVFGHRDHVEKLWGAGCAFDRVRLTGGGARSTVWSQIFADVLDVVVEVPDSVESGAKGAALAAGIGAGLYQDWSEAAERGVRVSRTHEPDGANRSLYAERYSLYRSLAESICSSWRRNPNEAEKRKL